MTSLENPGCDDTYENFCSKINFKACYNLLSKFAMEHPATYFTRKARTLKTKCSKVVQFQYKAAYSFFGPVKGLFHVLATYSNYRTI